MTTLPLRRLLAALLLLWPTAAWAQMHTTVQPDRVLIGSAGEFLSRRLDLPNRLVVGAGTTFLLPVDSTWDYLEVAGILRCDPTHDTTLRVTHLVILPGGLFECGTVATPMPATRHVTLIIRDVPIDTGKDPFQWGNGIVNFGAQTRVGATKTPFTEAVGGLMAGATTVTLVSAPVGWRVGDELLIPDTVTQTLGPDHEKTLSQRESKVTIASVNGATVVLSKPLDFDHPNIVTPDGVVVLRPRVANLTRNIVIRSENAAAPTVGTRGHTADVGMGATWNVRYNQFVQLGRTSNDPIDDAATAHPTTNQKGRYAHHHHHAGSSVGSADIGNVFLGNPTTTKWALAVHGTSDVLVEGNIAVDFPGAGFVTEDGYEVRDVFRKNLAAYIQGTPPALDPDGNIKVNRPGSEGSCFWFRGIMNTIDGNEAWNCYRSGFDLFNILQPAGSYPSVPGGMPDTPLDRRAVLPISFDGNIAAANNAGLEIWGIKRFPITHLIAAYNWDRQVIAASSDSVAFEIRDSQVVCEVGKGGVELNGGDGIHSGDGYVNTYDQFDTSILGCGKGIAQGGATNGINLTGGVLQNTVDIDRVHGHLLVDGTTFKPLGTRPKRYIETSEMDTPPGFVWDGVSPLPTVGFVRFGVNRGSDLIVKNAPGFGEAGKSYRLYFNGARGDRPAWYSTGSGLYVYDPPVKGLTWQQVWDQYGMGYLGGVVDPAKALTLDGLNYGVALEGTMTALGPPKAVITYPNSYEPFLPDLRVQLALTGDHTQASPFVFASVDDGPRIQLETPVPDADSILNDQRSFGLDGDAIAQGRHVLKVWRTTLADPLVPLPGADFSVVYAVGVVAPTPPAPPTLTAPLRAGDSVVRGAAAPAAIVHVLINAAAVGDVPADGAGAFARTVMPLVAGQVVTAIQTLGGLTSLSSTPVTVTAPLPPPMVLVPTVIGLTQAAATTSLTGAGLLLGPVTRQTSTTVPTGVVISQTPAAAALVARGSAVALTISLGGGPTSLPPAGTYTYVCDATGACRLTFVPKP